MDELISQISYIFQLISRLWSLTTPNWVQYLLVFFFYILCAVIIRGFIFQGITDRLDGIANKLDGIANTLDGIANKCDESSYKQDVALVHLENIQNQVSYQSSILANIDRRTHYRKIRGVPRD
ncbi:MAG: hypothetical protein EBY22_15575 [Gammaproteobacteria bacterium]|nr:hypothetical protein [Gammaproteobacteria bacterium]